MKNCNSAFDGGAMRRELGPLSSHPTHGLARLLLWSACALAPLLAGALVIFFWLQDGSVDRTRFLINHGRGIALYGFAATGFAMGFGLTAFAATVAARSQMLVGDRGVTWRLVLTVAVPLFLLGMAAWLVPLLASASTQTRLLVAWLGLLPLLLLMALATFLPHEDSAGVLLRRPLRLWSFVLPVVIVSLVGATRVAAASRWLEGLPFIESPLQVLLEAANTSGMSPEAAASMKSWFVTGIVGVAASPLLALAMAAMSLFGGVSESGGVSDRRRAVGAGQWRTMLLATLGAENAADAEIASETADTGAAVELATTPCNDFFAETPVSVDQSAALERIVSLSVEASVALADDPTQPRPSADVLLEGPNGSGRTATLIAALIQGALVTGDTAIILVASEAKRESLVTRLKLAARSLDVDGFIGVGHLAADAVAAWADVGGRHKSRNVPPVRREKESVGLGGSIPPRILVGTLEGLEETFFRNAYGFDAFRRMLCSIDTIAIDDVDGFPTQDRLHLPYALGKMRLIRAAEGLPLRTLVATRPLADAARKLVTKQLLLSASGERHTIRMRSVPLPPATSLCRAMLSPSDGHAESAADLLASCGRHCLAQGANVAIVVPGMGNSGLADIAARCQSAGRSVPADRLCVISDLDALPTLGSLEHGIVSSAARDAIQKGDHAGFLVAWQPNDANAVVFSVPVRESFSGEEAPEHALVVLPGRESDSLFAQHFASAARYIPRLQPIRRSVLSAMGFPAVGMLVRRPNKYHRGAGDMVALVDRVICLDPPDSEAGQFATDPVRWPSCAIGEFGDGGPAAPQRVAIRGVLPAAMGIDPDVSGESVVVVERPTMPSSNPSDHDIRTVLWRGADGADLARDDLAYMHSFCLETGQAVYVPSRIHMFASGQVAIEARPLPERSRHNHASMPVFDLMDLGFPSGVELTRLLQSASLAHRVAVYGIVPKATTSSGRVSAPFRQTATLAVRGLFDHSARVRDWGCDTRYEAAKFFVLFDAPDALHSSPELNDLLLVNWGKRRPETHGDYPELAAAITGAMSWQAPGLERLVRCCGFRIARGSSSPLVGLLFIEPRSTESSGFALMEPIVYDLDVMEEFFGRAASLLETSAGREDGSRLYVRAGSAMNPITANGRLTVDHEAVTAAATLLRSIANEAASAG